jgi:4-carboxymuconolactone decarboxylase
VRAVRLVDELHDSSRVGNALWAELRAEWSEAQLVELVALVGFYHLISFCANAFRLPLEPYGARFPER